MKKAKYIKSFFVLIVIIALLVYGICNIYFYSKEMEKIEIVVTSTYEDDSVVVDYLINNKLPYDIFVEYKGPADDKYNYFSYAGESESLAVIPAESKEKFSYKELCDTKEDFEKAMENANGKYSFKLHKETNGGDTSVFYKKTSVNYMVK